MTIVQHGSGRQKSDIDTAVFNIINRAARFGRENSTAIKIAQLAAVILGSAALAAAFFTPLLASIGLVVLGGLLISSAIITFRALQALVPTKHDMKNHQYTPQVYDGGRLYYEGDVPVLVLDSDDPYVSGKAHGYLSASAMAKMYACAKDLKEMNDQSVDPVQRTASLDAVRLQIPKKYLDELQGVADGYQEWRSGQSRQKNLPNISIDDILELHLTADQNHFKIGCPDKIAPIFTGYGNQSVACSSIVFPNSVEGPLFVRNLDWAPSLKLGQYSIVTVRRYDRQSGQRNSVSISFPGFVGVTTGMNDQGLSLSMNVCPSAVGGHVRGTPAVFYNRELLDVAKTAAEVKMRTGEKNPLGPYHITAADTTTALAVHLLQDGFGHGVSQMKSDTPLAVFNTSHLLGTDMMDSIGRQRQLNEFVAQNNQISHDLVVRLPKINNLSTIQSIIMNPAKKIIKVAFDNGFSGDAPLHELQVEKLLCQ